MPETALADLPDFVLAGYFARWLHHADPPTYRAKAAWEAEFAAWFRWRAAQPWANESTDGWVTPEQVARIRELLQTEA